MKCFKEPPAARLRADLLAPPSSTAGRARLFAAAVAFLGVEKRQLATAIGTSAQSLSAWLHGTYRVPDHALEAVAALLDGGMPIPGGVVSAAFPGTMNRPGFSGDSFV